MPENQSYNPTSTLSPNQYAAKGGMQCPVCHSQEIKTSGSVETDAGRAWQNVVCLKCGSEWVDHYILIGYDNLETQEKENEPNN